MGKLTEAQKKAQDNYAKKNREHRNYLSYRTTARSFIRNKATKDDLEELKELIKTREEEI
ncbi:hypothetical protein FEZ48_02080 [Marinilactibacillus psychrotolerans]|uniref:Uncharacterized protein n=1 Tax=Marinilactibacillus psychrotolerans TaxID=191770 RepID=A0A5R9C7V9_9LACT|nr:hypothetical protein [Marinilactibacillus psychrotolerans]TLQ09251.1 hypothetical protein FEZ48_02080 [Marinilactibacillus psychrotolerans]